MKYARDLETVSDIELIVNEFYKKIKNDEQIGYFFTEVMVLNFEVHIPMIVSFWDSILFGNTLYKGNPMIKHIELNRKSRLESKHFDRWLRIWEETIYSYFSGLKATEAINRAKGIAAVMQLKINQDSW